MRYLGGDFPSLRNIRRAGSAAFVATLFATPGLAAELRVPMPVKAPPVTASVGQLYDWTGFYVGAHVGQGWGKSNWTTAPDLSGSVNVFNRFDAFESTGGYFGGLQFGYDYMLPNRFVIGGMLDASVPSWPNLGEISLGGTSTFVSPALGQVSYTENVLHFGTLRGRVGYAPGNWLVYATGGLAWTYDQLTLTQQDNCCTTDSPFLWRLGWTAAGRRVPGGAELDGER